MLSCMHVVLFSFNPALQMGCLFSASATWEHLGYSNLSPVVAFLYPGLAAGKRDSADSIDGGVRHLACSIRLNS